MAIRLRSAEFLASLNVPNGDAAVAAWVARVVANGGATPSASTQTAASTFWNSVSALQSQVICLNFFAPDNLIACLTPFIKGPGNDPWINHNFVTGDLSVTGLQGNGSNKYVDTGITWANTAAIYGSNRFGIQWGTRSGGAGSGYHGGTFDGINGTSVAFMSNGAQGQNLQGDYWGADGSTTMVNRGGSFPGFLMAERYSLTTQTNYSFSSDNVGAYALNSYPKNTTATSELLTTLPIFWFCANGGSGTAGLPGGFLSTLEQWVSFSTAFNATDALTFASAAHILRNALGGSWN